MKYEESMIQQMVVAYIKNRYPEIILTCAPAYASNVKQGKRNKSMGLCKGWPDLFIAYPSKGYNGLFIELKTATGKLSKIQKELLEKLNDVGYRAVVAYGYDDAIHLVKKYLTK